MKKIDKAYIVIGLLIAAVLLWGPKPAFAQSEKNDDGTVVNKVGSDDKYDYYKMSGPGPDQNLTVIVQPLEKQTDEVVAPPASTPPVVNVKNVTVVSRLHLRGGFTVGTFLDEFNAGLTGEIGTSALRVQGTFRVGNYKDGVALNGGLAAMVVDKHFQSGLGVDLLYGSDLSRRAGETAKERLVGLSLHLGLIYGHVVVDGFVGLGSVTTQIPNGRQTQPGVYGGLSLSYLWGK